MVIRDKRFNLYLCLLLAVAAVFGCKGPEYARKHSLSTIRFHLEATRDEYARAAKVPILRQNPVWIVINREPFLTEENVKKATVIEDQGGFAIKLELDKQGSMLLDQISAGNRGRHYAIFCQFLADAAKKKEEGRWVAAPMFSLPMTNGIVQFTPDSTREEADFMVLGLNHMAKEKGTTDD
jgi:hypothetical protein